MIEVRDKDRIQIEITNACRFSCTNCYKFVGHHTQPYFMELATVKRAIDSIEGYQGQIGITGGEPTLHPFFSEICDYLRKKTHPDQRHLQTTGYKWREYRSIIKRTFADRVEYNDHSDDTQKHHPMLVAIKDVVPDDSLRTQLLNKCWVLEKWSATINSKGCFSCEIAGAFDVMYNGPGGHPIAKGWWAKSHENFNNPLERYCQLCGAALPQPITAVKNNKDCISISNYSKLKKLRTPKLLSNRAFIVEDKYSQEDINKISKAWLPWQHLGDLGPGKTIVQRYQGLNTMFLTVRLILRLKVKKFRTVEKHIGRMFWRIGRRIL